MSKNFDERAGFYETCPHCHKNMEPRVTGFMLEGEAHDQAVYCSECGKGIRSAPQHGLYYLAGLVIIVLGIMIFIKEYV